MSSLSFEAIQDAQSLSFESAGVSPASLNTLIETAITEGAGNPLFDSLSSIAGGALEFKGAWIPNTSPVLVNGTGNAGDVYIASQAGTFGVIPISLGDWMIYNGSIYQHFDNPTIATNAITQGNTSITVSDAGTGSIITTVDGVEKVRVDPNIIRNTLLQVGGQVQNHFYHNGSIVGEFYITNSSVDATMPINTYSEYRVGGFPLINNSSNTTTNVFSSSKVISELSGKEPTIAAGTTSQYYRGDKTWVQFPTINPANIISQLNSEVKVNDDGVAPSNIEMKIDGNNRLVVDNTTVSATGDFNTTGNYKVGGVNLINDALTGNNLWTSTKTNNTITASFKPFNMSVGPVFVPVVSETPISGYPFTYGKPKFSGSYMFLMASSGQTNLQNATLKAVCLSYDISTGTPVKIGELLVFSGNGYSAIKSTKLRGSYLIDSVNNGPCYVVNISNPKNMTVIQFNSPDASKYYTADIRGRYLYALRLSHTLDTWDLHAPVPVRVHSTTPGHIAGASFAFDMIVYKDTLYVSVSGATQSIDISNGIPVPQVSGGNVPITWGVSYTAIGFQDNYVYAGYYSGSGNGSKIRRYIIANSAGTVPLLDTTFGTAGTLIANQGTNEANDLCDDLEVSGNFLITVGRTDYRVFVYDLRLPLSNTSPLFVSNLSESGVLNELFSCSIVGDRLYCVRLNSSGGNFRVYNITTLNLDNVKLGNLVATNINTSNLNVDTSISCLGSVSIGGGCRIDDSVMIDGNLKIDADVDITTGKLRVVNGMVDGNASTLLLGVGSTPYVSVNATDTTVSNNLSITGNLTVNGTTSTLNSTIVSIDDPLLRLADNNIADITDTGFYSVQNTNKYSGLVRKNTTGVWYLTNLHTQEPSNAVDYTTHKGILLLGNVICDNVYLTSSGNSRIAGGSLLNQHLVNGNIMATYSGSGVIYSEFLKTVRIGSANNEISLLSIGEGFTTSAYNFDINRNNLTGVATIRNQAVNVMTIDNLGRVNIGADSQLLSSGRYLYLTHSSVAQTTYTFSASFPFMTIGPYDGIIGNPIGVSCTAFTTTTIYLHQNNSSGINFNLAGKWKLTGRCSATPQNDNDTHTFAITKVLPDTNFFSPPSNYVKIRKLNDRTVPVNISIIVDVAVDDKYIFDVRSATYTNILIEGISFTAEFLH